LSNKRKILIVEDEMVVAVDVKKKLEKLGYSVPAVVATGKMALRKTKESKPDLVLMDIVLKGQMDGIDTAEQIRKRFHIPVVYLTAYADIKIIEKAKKTEPYGYILKPFNDKELHSVVEITIYKNEMEKKFKESEERFETLFKYAPDAYYLIDLKGNFIDGNRIAEEVVGYKREELIGKNFLKLKLLSPDQIPKAAKLLVKNAMGKPTGPDEFILKRKDGKFIPVEIRTVLVNMDGKAVVLGIARDITVRKRYEEELKKKTVDLNERMKELNCLYGISMFVEKREPVVKILQGTVDLIPFSLQYSEMTCARIVLGESEYRTKGFKETACKLKRPIHVNGIQVGFLEVCNLSKKKKDAKGSFLKEEFNLIYDIAERLGDIIQQKRLEEERECLIRDLEERKAELERFIYTISHDLKNPLVTIGGFIGILEKDIVQSDENTVQTDITYISDSIKKMQQILDELLKFCRTGHSARSQETFHMGDLVKETLKTLSSQINKRCVNINVCSDLPIVYGDRERLYEVVLNLLKNAISFLGNQTDPLIEIGMKYDCEEPVFYIRDNGMGIDPQYQEKIFNLFEKIDQRSTGSGVGLAIAKRIIELQEGCIWVESEGKNKGSTFYFTVPGIKDNMLQ